MNSQKFLITLLITLPLGFVWSDLKDSPHDFSTQSWNSNGSLCQPCHSNHKGKNENLWSHDTSSTMYIMYPKDSLIGAIDRQPSKSSRQCLGCHDGTVSLGSFRAKGHRKMGNSYINPKSRLGTDLRNHHPISVSYLNSHKLTSSYGPSGMGRTIKRDLLRNGKVECVSCHDVHNRKKNGKMLIKRKENLCKTCHLQARTSFK